MNRAQRRSSDKKSKDKKSIDFSPSKTFEALNRFSEVASFCAENEDIEPKIRALIYSLYEAIREGTEGNHEGVECFDEALTKYTNIIARRV